MRSFPPLSLAFDLLIDMIQFQSQFPSLFGSGIRFCLKTPQVTKGPTPRIYPLSGAVRSEWIRHVTCCLFKLLIFFYATRPRVSPHLFGSHCNFFFSITPASLNSNRYSNKWKSLPFLIRNINFLYYFFNSRKYFK